MDREQVKFLEQDTESNVDGVARIGERVVVMSKLLEIALSNRIKDNGNAHSRYSERRLGNILTRAQFLTVSTLTWPRAGIRGSYSQTIVSAFGIRFIFNVLVHATKSNEKLHRIPCTFLPTIFVSYLIWSNYSENPPA